MKERKKAWGVVLVLLLTLLAGNGAALAEESGFSGYIMPVIGVARTKSLASVGDDNKRITSLDQDATAENSFLAVPSWHLGYTFEGGATRIWTGSSDDSPVGGGELLAVGFSHTLANQTTLVLSWAPPLMDGEVWEDPFLVGANRAETDLTTQSFHLGVASVWGTPLSLSYTYAIQDVERERSGFSRTSLSRADLEALKRSGDSHEASISYEISLGDFVSLHPGLSFTRGNADGAANQYDQYGAQIALTCQTGKATWLSALSVGQSEYDQANPVFGKTREDEIYALSLGLQYAAPFDYENWAVSLFSVYSRQDSNIGFYDESVLAGGLGLTWHF